MKYLFSYLMLFTTLTTFSGCDQPLIQKDMIAFDKAYIPVLYHVYKNDMNQAAKSMFMLDYQWQQFNSKYSYLGADDLDWKERSRLIDDWLGDTYDAIINNDQFTAFVQLDHVKYEMMEIRRNYDFNYFLDKVWDFEGSLNMLSEASSEDGTMLCSADEMSFLISETKYLWDNVEAAEMNNRFFGFDKEELVLFEQYKKEITQNLMQFEPYGSYQHLDKAVEQTIDSLMKFLILFGDFDSITSHYAQSR